MSAQIMVNVGGLSRIPADSASVRRTTRQFLRTSFPRLNPPNVSGLNLAYTARGRLLIRNRPVDLFGGPSAGLHESPLWFWQNLWRGQSPCSWVVSDSSGIRLTSIRVCWRPLTSISIIRDNFNFWHLWVQVSELSCVLSEWSGSLDVFLGTAADCTLHVKTLWATRTSRTQHEGRFCF